MLDAARKIGTPVRVVGERGVFRFVRTDGRVADLRDSGDRLRTILLERVSVLCARCTQRFDTVGTAPRRCAGCDAIPSEVAHG